MLYIQLLNLYEIFEKYLITSVIKWITLIFEYEKKIINILIKN